MTCINCGEYTPDAYFCCWSCETCWIIRMEHTAYFKGELKYPEFKENRDHYLLTGLVKNKNLRATQYRSSYLC
jgi:hypothetical protein